MVLPTPDPESSDGGVRTVKSADRALAVLEYLIESREPRTLRDVTRDLAIPRASAYALLLTLQRRGWVDVDDSRFTLGLRSLQAAVAAIDLDPTVRRTESIRHELNAELGETIHLGRLDGAEIVYVQTLTAPNRMSALTRPGRRLPAHASALGKALFAARPWRLVSEVLPKKLEMITPHTVTTRTELKKQLETTAKVGYSTEIEENTLGIMCYAIAVPADPYPSYAISCSVPLTNLDEEHRATVRNRLLQAANQLASNRY
ncbi:IclR family transcriptional regulator [Micromonospora inyonensis]|uniref:Glycerol operon regulatory protein n=1 Tax=Micromonospora inyonensis TaxID=47866 RepID=A0A1C6S636_9ACTN|nr:IclR family transcriptional regulator [Micromonospora inyonensis]SCL24921.1 DNA-binding transcriptional regulator, IclR family [Micromonospora inyonensis]